MTEILSTMDFEKKVINTLLNNHNNHHKALESGLTSYPDQLNYQATESEFTSNSSADNLNLTDYLTFAFLLCIILISIIGNFLVCLAIFTDRRLRKLGNAFIVSLAVADLFVSSLVMTFALVNDFMNYWTFGKWFCEVWISFDIMCCTASILNLCAISLDRFIHIKDCLMYNQMMTKRVAISFVLLIWFTSAIISFVPMAFGWRKPEQTSSRPNELTLTQNQTKLDSDLIENLQLQKSGTLKESLNTEKHIYDQTSEANTKILQSSKDSTLRQRRQLSTIMLENDKTDQSFKLSLTRDVNLKEETHLLQEVVNRPISVSHNDTETISQPRVNRILRRQSSQRDREKFIKQGKTNSVLGNNRNLAQDQNIYYSNYLNSIPNNHESSIDNINMLNREKFQCVLTLTPSYAVVSSTISFYLPCLIMLGLYIKLYACAKKHVRSIQALSKVPIPAPRQQQIVVEQTQFQTSTSSLTATRLQNNEPIFIKKSSWFTKLFVKHKDDISTDSIIEKHCMLESIESKKDNNELTRQSSQMKHSDKNNNTHGKSENMICCEAGNPTKSRIDEIKPFLNTTIQDKKIDLNIHELRPSSPNSQSFKMNNNIKSGNQQLATQKAAITLGIIMGTFLLCWVPFFCINIIKAFCKDCIPDSLFRFLTWLGYANSALNPIIYGIHNTEFRNAFNRIFFKHFKFKDKSLFIPEGRSNRCIRSNA